MGKKDTRERILSSGKKWFLEKGFKGAPLRKIVSETGFTLGAFYGYFKTKEDLFYALTDEAAEGLNAILMECFEEMQRLDEKEKLTGMNDVYLKYVPEIVRYVDDHRDAFYLILKCSAGTKYESFLEDFSRMDASYIASLVQSDFFSPAAVEALGKGYFSMIAEILLMDIPEEKKVTALKEVQSVFNAGVLQKFAGR